MSAPSVLEKTESALGSCLPLAKFKCKKNKQIQNIKTKMFWARYDFCVSPFHLIAISSSELRMLRETWKWTVGEAAAGSGPISNHFVVMLGNDNNEWGNIWIFNMITSCIWKQPFGPTQPCWFGFIAEYTHLCLCLARTLEAFPTKYLSICVLSFASVLYFLACSGISFHICTMLCAKKFLYKVTSQSLAVQGEKS